MKEEIKKLADIIKQSGNIVFFGGAGVSTESNIPDFRSEDGIFSAVSEYGYAPEEILSKSFFDSNKEVFYKYYRNNLLFPDAKPSKAHIALALLEKQGKLKAVITQNIDNLHQMAGSKNVIELHGSLYRNYCLSCGKKFGIDYVLKSKGVTKCDSCKGIVRPDVVLYEERLDEGAIEKALYFISNAEVLIVGGTSLNVYPAAGFVRCYNGDRLVLINKSETQFDSAANLIIRDKIGEVLDKAVKI